MPKTKFQDVVFTIMMVIVMVYAMVVYNIAIDKGGLTNNVFVIALAELIIMCPVAFVLEMLIAGRLAQKLAFRMFNPEQDKIIFVILAVSAITVCLMCPMMSFVATVLFKGGFNSQIIATWVETSIINFPMALCWQLFAAGPLVRLIFGKIFKQAE